VNAPIPTIIRIKKRMPAATTPSVDRGPVEASKLLDSRVSGIESGGERWVGVYLQFIHPVSLTSLTSVPHMHHLFSPFPSPLVSRGLC
jgi:hypothetical protein